MYTNQEQLEIAISRLNDLELLVKDLYNTNKTFQTKNEKAWLPIRFFQI